ncbi:hypothetical protein HYH03_000487 [Edaphochlamys debaryana]|uniref:Peptidase M20 dimerisation domain-containing protein n=1 Tax=Edaphochlamys debaryana TaxID=47281 RepID=A0A835YG87_9CHLO|nr:hypothetical protein HYH03_000487 [Edaphochlamys debaryana]|eukprot:KAG2501991.1 hypothetical protein HYH03_000487 [Edaphochlamys debaryana]
MLALSALALVLGGRNALAISSSYNKASLGHELSASGEEGTFVPQSCLSDADFSAVVQRFSKFLQFRTTSSPTAPDHVLDPAEFRRLHAWLPQAYPEVWAALKVEEVGSNGLSFLLTWPGSQPPGGPLLPVLLLSHLDVVPVANETLAQWEHPPFSGAVAGGYVWGRGAMDDKVGVSGLLEAATLLLREGWAPRRTLYLAFGQDEEVGGDKGAARIADLLEQRGVKVDMVYDEGGSIGRDGFPPYSPHPLALVGLAEKGYATINIQINATGGHSSIPPLDGSSVAAVAARVVTAIDRRPPPTRLVEPVASFLAAIAPATPGLRGRLFALSRQLPWVGGLVAAAFLGRDTPETAALVRDTAAVTGLTLGFADNVLPPGGTVRVNFRLLPGSSVDDVLDYLTQVVGRDLPYLRFEARGDHNASTATPVTSPDSPYFAMLRTAVQEVYQLEGGKGTVAVAPTLMAGGTDSKHYLRLSVGGALRHVPTSMNKTAGDMRRVHGLNERVSVGDLGRCVCVHVRLLQMLGAGAPAA